MARRLVYFLLLCAFVMLAEAACDPGTPTGYPVYSGNTYATSSVKGQNFMALQDYLVNNPPNSLAFTYVSVGNGSDVAYGKAECYNAAACTSCLQSAMASINTAAPNTDGARFCTSSCYIRFETYAVPPM